MDYRLQDLVDVDVLQEMLNRLHDTLPLTYVIVGRDGTRLAETASRALCKMMECPHSKAEKACRQANNLHSLSFSENSEIEISTCPQGFAYGVAPIFVQGSQVASLYVGQLFLEPPGERLVLAQPVAHGCGEEECLRAIGETPVMSSVELGRSLAMLRTFTGLLGEMGAKRLAERRAQETLRAERRQAEADLRAYRERLDLVMKNLDAVIFHLDRDGVLTFIEGRGLAKINRMQPHLVGRKVSEIHGNNPAVVHALERALAGNSETVEYELAGMCFEENYTPFPGPDGKQDGVIGMAVEITDRKRAEQRLREEKERLKVTLQSIGDGVIATDAAGRVALMNNVAEKLTGWPSRKAMGKPFDEVFDIRSESTGEKTTSPVERVLSTGKTVGLENHTTLRAADGTVRSISDNAAPILDGDRRILGVILVFRDVTESKKRENEIAYLSYHDRLTGIYNRAFLEEEARRLDTSRQLPISVIMGDVNGLKLTNDVFGHAEGDNLLKRIAVILRDCCRNEDIVARVGGDEFCILLPQTDYAAASGICKRMTDRCESADLVTPVGGAKLSISLGCATKTGAHQNMTDVMKDAEDSMYRRKLLESRSQHSFLIASIRTTLFEKSYETEMHAQRLIAYSKAIAQALNLPDDQINDIELFALLHDIGKIAIDSHILTKPDKLGEEEWEEMRRHPEIGFRIAQASPDLAHISEHILCHHERWDGAGYPQGLKGTAIPLLARILLVVDAYDAMTQDRVYRKAMSREEACVELLKNAGTQFDPNIVLTFMELLENNQELA